MVRFTTKTVESLTLGEKLKKIRSERRLSVSEVSKNTKIQTKYIDYLEAGEYSKLPADVYVKGFLRSYAIYFGLTESSLIKQFEREKDIHKNIKKIDTSEKPRFISYSNFVLTPKIAIATLICFSVVSIFFYLYKEVNSFVSNPRLVILKPATGATVEGKNVRLEGIAEKDSQIFINEQPVIVNEKGEFAEDVNLQEGLNTITVRAKNKFDKEARESLSVNANYAVMQADLNQALEPVKVELTIKDNATWISVESEGNVIYSGEMPANSTQVFEAKEKISISSGNGINTYLKVNDKDLGQLSNQTGIVKDVEFNSLGRIK